LVERLNVDETQAIHLALQATAVKLLPQCEPDKGPLTEAQLRQVKHLASKRKTKSVSSSLFAVGVA
jgi:hypothetical protein